MTTLRPKQKEYVYVCSSLLQPEMGEQKNIVRRVCNAVECIFCDNNLEASTEMTI